MRSFFLRPLQVLTALLTLATATIAQQRVCMSLHGGPAAGVNSLGAPAQVAGRVNGVQVSVPTAAGQGAPAASAAHEAAFVAAGFTTVRVNANLFCVTAGPFGAAITSGLCYGTDDMGFNLDSSVALIPPAGGGVPAPGAKPGGVVVPVPPVQQPPRPVTGTIIICFDVWVNGVHVRICITIILAANMPGQQLQQSILQQLVAQGFQGNFVKLRDPLAPTQLIDALQVDRTVAGNVVDGVEYQYDALSRQILPSLTGAGVLPEFGGTEYGTATQGNAPAMPWSRLQGQPRINGFFDVVHELELPNLPGGIVINLAPGTTPLLNGQLLVHPVGAVFEFGVSNGAGTMHRGWTVPGSASLIGLPIHEQAGVIDNRGTVSMSTGIRAVIGS